MQIWRRRASWRCVPGETCLLRFRFSLTPPAFLPCHTIPPHTTSAASSPRSLGQSTTPAFLAWRHKRELLPLAVRVYGWPQVLPKWERHLAASELFRHLQTAEGRVAGGRRSEVLVDVSMLRSGRVISTPVPFALYSYLPFLPVLTFVPYFHTHGGRGTPSIFTTTHKPTMRFFLTILALATAFFALCTAKPLPPARLDEIERRWSQGESEVRIYLPWTQHPVQRITC